MIITIGREYGSGGREIGQHVAQKLGIPFYDKEILTRAAQESGLCHEVFEHHDEKASVGGMLTSAGAGMHMGASHVGLQMPLNQRVFLAQFDAITKIAAFSTTRNILPFISNNGKNSKDDKFPILRALIWQYCTKMSGFAGAKQAGRDCG